MVHPGFIVAGGITLLIGTIIFISYQYEKKRTEHFKNYAGMHGYSFFPKKEMKDIQITKQFKIFIKGHSNKIKNYMSGRKRGIQWDIFEYRYTIGGGKQSHTYNQTIAATTLEKTLPTFTMGPENFLHKFGEIFGLKDIDFDTHPEFSKKYLLQSNDPDIRSFFNSERMTFFEQLPLIYNVETYHKYVLIYRTGKRVKKNELKSFIDTAGSIADKISR